MSTLCQSRVASRPTGYRLKYSECGLWYTSSRPAKKIALKVVVVAWLMPPPSRVLILPPSMPPPAIQPAAAVRFPSVAFMLNVSPGLRNVPLISRAALPMLFTRYADPGK